MYVPGALAFLSLDALPLVLAGLAVIGAVLAGGFVLRTRRRSAAIEDERRRRAPSPSSVGLADDPIVTALRAGRDDSRRRAKRRVGPPSGDEPR